ncbi:MAG TPA: Wzy polymerase domain-containing protein [Ramlibacter sp.]|nr:Wzy polymerase domain-containing protein [Ramlibacter sp.]
MDFVQRSLFMAPMVVTPGECENDRVSTGPAVVSETKLEEVLDRGARFGLRIRTPRAPCPDSSPEPRVVERVIEAATMQGRTDEAVLHLARYRAAFPKDYEKWRAAQKRGGAPGNPASGRSAR